MIVLVVLIVLMAWMLIAVAVYNASKNMGVVDVFWAGGFFLAAIIYFFHTGSFNFFNLIALALVVLWSARLAGFLLIYRVLPKNHDPRYEVMAKGSNNPVLFQLKNCLVQGLLVFVISLSFYFLFQTRHVFWWQNVGLVLVLIGILFEAYCDQVLQNFKDDGQDGLCQRSWWKYSRHPNLFFECLVWVGFFIACLNQPLAIVAVISPVTIILIVSRLTGPITEKHSLTKHGDVFRQYQQEVSYIVPWKRKVSENENN